MRDGGNNNLGRNEAILSLSNGDSGSASAKRSPDKRVSARLPRMEHVSAGYTLRELFPFQLSRNNGNASLEKRRMAWVKLMWFWP